MSKVGRGTQHGDGVRRYFFDLLGGECPVSDPAGTLLLDNLRAEAAARELARNIKQSRPELIGRGYVIRVRNESGDEIAAVSIDSAELEGSAPE